MQKVSDFREYSHKQSRRFGGLHETLTCHMALDTFYLESMWNIGTGCGCPPSRHRPPEGSQDINESIVVFIKTACVKDITNGYYVDGHHSSGILQEKTRRDHPSRDIINTNVPITTSRKRKEKEDDGV